MSQADVEPQHTTGEQSGGLLREELASKLGMLGLSEAVTGELLDRINRAAFADPMSQYRIIAGLTLVAEGLGLPAKSVEKIELVHEPIVSHEAPSAVLPQQPSRASYPNPAAPVRALELVHERDLPALLQKSSEQKEDKEPLLNKNTQRFLDNLLKLHNQAEYTLPEMTQTQAREFVVNVAGVYRDVKSSHESTTEKRVAELLLYVDGYTDKDIFKNTNATSPDAVCQARKTFIKTLASKGYHAEPLRVMLDDFLDRPNNAVSPTNPEPLPPAKDEVEEIAETVVPTADTPAEEPELGLSPQEITDGLVKLCSEHWTHQNVVSLRAILENQLDDADQPARALIGMLMAEFVPTRTGALMLERAEWDALNQISGYKLEQGRKRKTVENLRYLLNGPDTDITDPAVLFKGALYKLIKFAAQQEFEQKPAPPAPDVGAPEQEQPAEPAPIQPESAQKPEKPKEPLAELMNEICTGFGFSPQVMRQLSLHFGPDKGDINANQLANGLRAVRWMIDKAISRAEILKRGRPGTIDSKELLLPVDIGLLHLLAGTTTQNPISAKQFAARELQRVPDIQPQMVYRRIYDVFAKAERLSRGKVAYKANSRKSR